MSLKASAPVTEPKLPTAHVKVTATVSPMYMTRVAADAAAKNRLPSHPVAVEAAAAELPSILKGRSPDRPFSYHPVRKEYSSPLPVSSSKEREVLR